MLDHASKTDTSKAIFYRFSLKTQAKRLKMWVLFIVLILSQQRKDCKNRLYQCFAKKNDNRSTSFYENSVMKFFSNVNKIFPLIRHYLFILQRYSNILDKTVGFPVVIWDIKGFGFDVSLLKNIYKRTLPLYPYLDQYVRI